MPRRKKSTTVSQRVLPSLISIPSILPPLAPSIREPLFVCIECAGNLNGELWNGKALNMAVEIPHIRFGVIILGGVVGAVYAFPLFSAGMWLLNSAWYAEQNVKICRMLFPHWISVACSRAFTSEGKRIEISTATMAITTSNSTRVKPCSRSWRPLRSSASSTRTACDVWRGR